MKIVHVADSLQVGGAEVLIAQLCRIQREQGHTPSVYCLDEIGSIGAELQKEGFEVLLHSPPTFHGLTRRLYRSFKLHRPDSVHFHNAQAAIVGAGPARMAGVRSVIATRHGLVSPPHQLRRELKFALASRFCDWVVAVCEEARRNLLAGPFSARKKIIRIYNGVAEIPFNSGRSISKNGFTLLHVARMAPIKDQESLLRAFALAKQCYPELQLWLVGDGPLRSRLEQISQELCIDSATHFFGEQLDVSPFYRRADRFVMSSLSEGLPCVSSRSNVCWLTFDRDWGRWYARSRTIIQIIDSCSAFKP